MRRLPTMMASASAAALTTLAVTVAVPAIADDPPTGKSDDGFAACLRDHGLDGAPEGAALKPWLGERLDRGDAATQRALKQCSPEPGTVKPGPSEQELRSCLKDHGVEVAGDARALKQWIVEHGGDAANRDALRACDIGPVPKPLGAAACDKDGAVAPATQGGRADDVTTVEARGSGTQAVSNAG